VKTFIVFIGVVAFVLISLSFQNDMNRMVAARYALKDIAAECAFGAAVIAREMDLDARDERIEHYVSQTFAGGFACEGYRFELTESEGILTVAVEADVEDFFRLPFLSAKQLSVSASAPLG
jgi:hypothetical protein